MMLNRSGDERVASILEFLPDHHPGARRRDRHHLGDICFDQEFGANAALRMEHLAWDEYGDNIGIYWVFFLTGHVTGHVACYSYSSVT